jgi:hypothetical protein
MLIRHVPVSLESLERERERAQKTSLIKYNSKSTLTNIRYMTTGENVGKQLILM